MSRSRKMVPIVGITGASSEAQDKKIWHKRLRSGEAIRLKKLVTSGDDLESHMPRIEIEAVDVWSMAKDGRGYSPLRWQRTKAEMIATRKGKSTVERQSLKQRLLKKWMAK